MLALHKAGPAVRKHPDPRHRRAGLRYGSKRNVVKRFPFKASFWCRDRKESTMRQPTEAERELAVERVMTIARMGLGGGVAIFSDGLERVASCNDRPWEAGCDYCDGDEIMVRIPRALSDDELLEACGWEVTEGIFDRDRRCRVMIADLHLDIGDDEAALQWVGGIEDDVQRDWWRRQLTGSEA